ncbi:MAG: AbrB/MazE/SpoVT family DNA-binding domain-containing protein [Candidatus Liptonbacteria bacterium]|nr:AbrB/MazE/SpoVT family DNA-binding domain-containing protein [Candidatus Liptonbacteria bacterium]
MTQKVLKVGSSAAVTIPKKSLKELGLKIGDEVRVAVDAKARVVSIVPARALSSEDQRIARLTLRFIERYRKDLEELAKK